MYCAKKKKSKIHIMMLLLVPTNIYFQQVFTPSCFSPTQWRNEPIFSPMATHRNLPKTIKVLFCTLQLSVKQKQCLNPDLNLP